MQRLVSLFAEVLMVNAAELNEESSPATVREWDSVAAMALVAAIEETFDVQLSTREIMTMRSIGLAYRVLVSKGVVI